jgi:hypothetical protein
MRPPAPSEVLVRRQEQDRVARAARRARTRSLLAGAADLFFPEPGDTAAAATTICASCPARAGDLEAEPEIEAGL